MTAPVSLCACGAKVWRHGVCWDCHRARMAAAIVSADRAYHQWGVYCCTLEQFRDWYAGAVHDIFLLSEMPTMDIFCADADDSGTEHAPLGANGWCEAMRRDGRCKRAEMAVACA